MHGAEGCPLVSGVARVRARCEVDGQLVFVNQRLEARIEKVVDNGVDLVLRIGIQVSGLSRQHPAHEIAALGGVADARAGNRAGCARSSRSGAVQHAGAPPALAFLALDDHMTAVDQSLQVLANGVGMKARGLAQFGDGPL